MRVLITGALGHIGSYVVRRFPDAFENSHTILIDNLLTQRYASLFDLPSKGRHQFHNIDVVSKPLDSLLAKCDAVIHLAAITDAASSVDNKQEVFNNNLGATKQVAGACLRQKVPLIFLSSTSVYGTSEKAVDENCNKSELRPQSPYAECKLAEEAFVRQLGEQGLQYVIFRFGTIFGTSVGMRFHTAVNKFCWQASLGHPVTVWRSALHQLRPYLALDDAASAIFLVLRKGLFQNDTYNVLTVNSSVENIIDLIRKRVPDLQVELVDERIMNQLSFEVRSEKFKKVGFAPRGSLEQGINETLDLLKGAYSLAG